ncbi:hypothetical protein [Pseudoalteromonas rubra]|nr:hypothetical protein [Pseudoalteromonas rubra]
MKLKITKKAIKNLSALDAQAVAGGGATAQNDVIDNSSPSVCSQAL